MALSLFFFLPLLCFSLDASAHYLSETRETQFIRQISWHNPTVNSRPLIGIPSQPGDGDGGLITRRNGWNQSSVSYIPASYVKFVEMGGARAIPLLYNEPEPVLRRVWFLISPSLSNFILWWYMYVYLWMYECMYVCSCICTYFDMFLYEYIQIHAYTYVYKHTYRQINAHILMHSYIDLLLKVKTHVCIEWAFIGQA
mgnify:CR=1 FL=1